jgi:hypothetical protein
MVTRVLTLLLAVLVVFSISSMAQDKAVAANKFVGVKACSMCHKSDQKGNQFGVWQKSKHAEAYKTLTGAKAADIAKAKGIKNAAEAPECLSCHGAVDPKLVDKYDAKDGVQCETCHGAGSAYKGMAIMKDKAKAIAAGLHEFKDKAAIEKFCTDCHNEKSPTFKEFKFDEAWGKIKHTVPKG